MDEDDALQCERCGNADGDVGEDAGPEYCECCDDVLCELCWFKSHVLVFK